MRNNKNFNHIKTALGLSNSELFKILGGEFSKSKIDGWSRNSNARKKATGNSNAKTVSRFREMTDNEFDLFCEKLQLWNKKKVFKNE